MTSNMPKLISRVAALALAGGLLAGCVYYPNDGYYAPAPAVVVAPAPVVVGGWWGWGGGCCWGGGWHHDGGWRH